jgi:hypothetical protein
LADEMAGAIERNVNALVTRAEQAAVGTEAARNDIALYAKDAEDAAISASQFLNAVNVAKTLVDQARNSQPRAQLPGDHSATGATLTMATAPGPGAHFWVVWFANAGALP